MIKIRGARVNNLKNIDLDIPTEKVICISGPSGSGKTSIGFHTLLAESKRRFINSFPNSVKFFTERPTPVDVDSINPVYPVFGLPQINPVVGSRSTIGDIAGITELLQNLFAHLSTPVCPHHGIELIDRNLFFKVSTIISEHDEGEIFYLLIKKNLFLNLYGESFLPPRGLKLPDKKIVNLEEGPELYELTRFRAKGLAKKQKVIDEFAERLIGEEVYLFSEKVFEKINCLTGKSCPQGDHDSPGQVIPSSFSPYSPLGACSECQGFGANLIWDEEKLLHKEKSINEGGIKFIEYAPFAYEKEAFDKLIKKYKWSREKELNKLPQRFFEILYKGDGNYCGFYELFSYLESKKYKSSVRIFIRKYQKEEVCSICHGSRINPKVFNYLFQGKSIVDYSQMNLAQAFAEIAPHHKSKDKILAELYRRIKMACDIGLGHLRLNRKTKSLSAGEYQRLLLLKYLSFNGTGSLFVLDEPSLGLNQENLKFLQEGLNKLVQQGNTVLLIDHSFYLQKNADHLILMGPESGEHGGEVIFSGSPKKYSFAKDLSSQVRKNTSKTLEIKVKKPSIYEKIYPDFSINTQKLTWVYGESGSGKTSCLIRIFANEVHRKLFQEKMVDENYKVQLTLGRAKFSSVIVIDSNLNRFTSRSTIGSLTGLASAVRKHFLKLKVSKSMGLKEGHFSANSELGMCPTCEGKGIITIEMQYLEDITLTCEDCNGMAIKPNLAQISDGKMSVYESSKLPLSEVLKEIKLTPKFKRIYEYLKILNLDYLSLNRQINSLSGGERQRVYLLSKLQSEVKNALIVCENLSFGLSPKELKDMAKLLRSLTHLGNTIIVIDADDFWAKWCDEKLQFQDGKIKKS